jgi:GNAT superfamily N-acetyltransferase
MENEWTPPSDAVEVKGSSSFVPPSDAVEVVKKKDLTASGSAGSSSARLTTTTTKATASSSSRRFAGATVEPISQKKVRTDDYIDQVQNAKTQPKQTKTVVANTFVPKAKAETVDVITTDEANKMMAEDFGKKEFDLYSKISEIDKNILNSGEYSAVEYLNNKFKGSGFIFEETGFGTNEVRVKSTLNDGLGTVVNEKIIKLPTTVYTGMGLGETTTPEKSQKEIADFMNQAFLKKSEKEFLNKDVKDYGQLVKLAADNPYKYGEGFLNQYDTERWLDGQYRDLVIEGKSIQREKQTLQSEIEAYQQSGVRNEETERLLRSRQANLQNQIQANTTKYEELKDISTKLPKAAAVYFQNKEKEGNALGLITRSLSSGLMNMEKALITTAVDVAPLLIPSEYMIPEVQQVRLKASGMSDSDIKDYASKQLRKGVVTDALEGAKDLYSLGTTEAYAQSEDRNDIEKTASFLAESIGTALSAGGNPLLTKLAFFSQSYNAIEDEMNSSEFDGMSQMEKKIMSVPYGLVIGQLDRLGFKLSTGIAKNAMFNKLITNTIANAFTSIPKNASIQVMEQAISESLKATMAKTGLEIIGGALVEGATEGAQSLAEYGMKNLYNNFVADKDVFQGVPDITTKEGFEKALGAAKEEAYYGTLGGLIMASGSTALQSISKGFNKGTEEFDFFSKVINDPKLRALIETDIKTKITSGEITKVEAREQLDAINKSVSILNKMPENLPSESKMEAYNLILEKSKIEKETLGKDPALVVVQTERVAEINEQLKQLSKDAVQKQTTGEVSVQPGAESGGEMAQGESQAGPQEVTKEGQQAQEVNQSKFVAEEATRLAQENISTEERQSLVDKLYDDPIAYAKENAAYEITGGIYTDFLNSIEQQPVNIENKSTKKIANELNAIDNTDLKKQLGIESNWDMTAEGDFLAGNDPVLAYTQRKLPEWNRQSQLGEINPESELTYDIVKGRFGGKDNKNVVTAKDENGVTVGIIKLASNGGIEHIAVAPEFKGKGVASKLIEVLKENNPELDLSKTKLRSKDFEKAFSNTIIAEAYKKAKQDGSNPELVKAVENSLSNKNLDINQKQTNLAQNETGKIQPERTGDGRGRTKSRSLTPLEGAPAVPGINGPDPQIVGVAEQYAADNGIDLKRQSEYVEVDEDRAKRLADAYEQMADDSNDPKVKEAYEDLINQTKAQYQALADAGYKFWFMDFSIPSNEEYASTPYNALRDLRQNKEMGVFATIDGYGEDGITQEQIEANPMLADTGLMWPIGGIDGEMMPVLVNDLFRAVHDAFGHGLEGAGFRARGEENAWQAHVRLFTGPAIGAITSETRGQNSWVNFGPNAEFNRTASGSDTKYAPQKVGLMPEWTWTEGRAGDMSYQDNLVTNENINDIINSQDIETRQKIAKSAKLVMKAIPEAKIYLHDNTAEYDAAVGEKTKGKEKGRFVGTDMAIHVNMEEAASHTLLHEAFHYVILNKELDAKVLNGWTNSLRSIIKDEKLIKRIDDLLKKYSAEKQPEEYISELGAIMGAAKGQLSTSALQKFKSLINKIAKAIGLPPIFTAASTTQDAVDFINTISKQLATGDQIFANGFQTRIVPADLAPKKQVKVSEDQKLTFVKQSDIVDFKSLVDDIISKDQTVWFWVADQLGRGIYFDSELNGNHYLDAGPSFALDPDNRKNGIIWASGANKSTLEKNINNSDYIFIISGSPQQSKLFNKTVSSLVKSKIEAKVDFNKFKSSILEAKPTKAIKEILEKYNSYDEVFLGADRKKFIIAINEQKLKGTAVKKLLESYDAFLETNELRDGFFKDNDFKMGDVMLVLKPTAVGGKSKHSTYENDILGEVIGVPDIIVNSYDIMPEEVRNKYRDDLDRAQQQQVVAPYGIGLKKVKQVPEIKKQKGFSKQEAIRKAKEKYVLSVKERGNTPEQGVTSALEDLRKSEWYNEADDLMREEAERELKKFFGQRMKSAPSVGRLMGVKPTKVQVDEAAALKSQLRLEARAAREAKMDLNAKRKALVSTISAMVKDGKISTRQSKSIINKVGKVNLDNPIMVERLINYAEKVFQRADYQERLSEASKIRKSIRRALKSKEIQAEVAGMAKMFTKVDPFLVEDIDQYISNAENVLNAVRPARGLEVAIRQSANIAAINEFTMEQIELQEKNKKAELMAVHNYLVESGAITEDMTSKEMQEIIDIINTEESEINDPDKKMNFLKNRFEFMSGIIEKMIVNNEDPFTEESLDLTPRQKELMGQLLKINMDRLSVKQAALVLEAMDNFMNNGITSGVEAVVKNYQGTLNADRLAASGKRSRPLKMYFNKGIGKLFGEQFVSLPLLIERMFPGMKNGLKLMSDMGLTDVIRGAAKADYEHKQLVKQYTEQGFYKQKGFMNADNVYERGMLAFLSRNLIGTETERRNEFTRRVKIIEESIKELEAGSAAEVKMADLYQKAYDKLKVSERDIDVIKANAEQMNLDAVDWMTNQWASKYNQLADVSLAVYNSILGSDTNYTPDRYKSLEGADLELDEDLLSRGSAFMSSLDYTNKNKSGVLIETTRPKNLPNDRFISLDFDTNNFASLKGAMIDIETAPSIRQVDGFLKSDGYKKMVNGDDRKILTSRINNYISAVKGKTNFNRDTLKSVERLANFLGSLGVGKALGGLDQAVKQTTPVIVNTIMNAGRFTPLNMEMNEAINRSGMPIANRGIESITAVESIDSLIDKKSTTAAEAVKVVEKISQMYMKALLSKPDVWVARSSFVTYYQKYLRDNGMDTDIDWKDHEWNKEAMEYAQMMVDRQQNISDEKLAGKFLSSRDPMISVARKVVFPFATFILNQKARMHNDFIALFGSDVSTEDRVKAGKSLGGLAAEMITYQAIAYFIKTMVYDNIAAYIVGDDEEEEKKERSFFGIKMTKKEWNATKFPVKSFVSDLLSPLPLTDDLVTFGFDKMMENFPMITQEEITQSIEDQNAIRSLRGQEPMNAEQEANFTEKLKQQNTYSVTFKTDGAGRAYGVPGIAFDTYMELAEMGRMAVTGEFTEDIGYGPKTKYLTKEGQELVKYMTIPMVLYSTGLVPKDFGTVARKVVNSTKKKAISETKNKNIGLLKEELGRKPNEWEKNLVINTDKRLTGLVDAIKFAETYANLTPAQGEEYVKVLKEYSDYDFFILKALENNIKAEDIIKSIKETGNTRSLSD